MHADTQKRWKQRMDPECWLAIVASNRTPKFETQSSSSIAKLSLPQPETGDRFSALGRHGLGCLAQQSEKVASGGWQSLQLGLVLRNLAQLHKHVHRAGNAGSAATTQRARHHLHLLLHVLGGQLVHGHGLLHRHRLLLLLRHELRLLLGHELRLLVLLLEIAGSHLLHGDHEARLRHVRRHQRLLLLLHFKLLLLELLLLIQLLLVLLLLLEALLLLCLLLLPLRDDRRRTVLGVHKRLGR